MFDWLLHVHVLLTVTNTLKFHGTQSILIVTAHLSIGVNGDGGWTCRCIHDGQGWVGYGEDGSIHVQGARWLGYIGGGGGRGGGGRRRRLGRLWHPLLGQKENGILKEDTLLAASVCSDKTDHRVHNNGSIVFLSNCKFMKTKVLYIMKNCNWTDYCGARSRSPQLHVHRGI